MCRYKPNTHDIVKDAGERAYWLGVLRDAVPVSVDKASLSEERSPGTCLIPATPDNDTACIRCLLGSACLSCCRAVLACCSAHTEVQQQQLDDNKADVILQMLRGAAQPLAEPSRRT